MLSCNVVITCLMNGYICYLSYYFSHWGTVSAFINSVFVALAARYPETYTKPALITSEIALGLNLSITPMFWAMLAPSCFKGVGWSGYDLVCRIHWSANHILPVTYCIINFITTRQLTLFTEDWRLIFVLCLIYPYFNYLGTIC